MTADSIYGEGLEIPPWSQATIKKISEAAPDWVNVKNPLDIGPSGIFPTALQAIFSDPNPDGFILIPVIPYAAIDAWLRLGINAKALLGNWPALKEKIAEKPVVAVLLGCREWTDQVKELCGDAITTVSSLEAATKALSSLYRFSQPL